jgi:hypothetical protein
MPTPDEAIGSQTRVIWREEDTWGENPGGSDWSGLRFRTEGLATEIAKHVDESIDPSRSVQHVRGGKKHPGGDIEVSLAPQGHNTFIRHCLGGSLDTSGSGPYTHVVKAGPSWPVGGLAIEVGFTQNGHYFTFLGCRINEFSLDIPMDGIVSATFAILARSEEYDTVTNDGTVILPTVEPYVSHEMELFESGALSEVKPINCKFSVNNQAEESCDVAPDRERFDIPPGTRLIEGTIVLYFNSIALYNKFKDETPSVLRIKLTGATGESSQYDFPRIKFVGGSPTPSVDGSGPVQVEYPFQAIYDAVEETDIIYTAVTDEATI